MELEKVDEGVLDKITKLLALAERGGTEAEAVAAMEAAQRLLARYNLSLTEVKDRELAEKDPMTVDDAYVEIERVKLERWAVDVGDAAATLYFCNHLKSHQYKSTPCGSKVWVKLTHYFVGRRSNTEVARVMTKYLIDTVLRLSREAAVISGLRGAAKARYERDFRDGAALRLRGRCAAIIAGKVGEPDNSNLPALYKTRQKEAELHSSEYFKGRIRTSTIRRPMPGEGYFDGARAADKISLNQQLDKKPRGPLLN